jgi:hypothetical protein
LQKELKDARSAVVDIDGAYKKLSQTMAQFRSGMGARGAIPMLPVQCEVRLNSLEVLNISTLSTEILRKPLMRVGSLMLK